MWARHSVAACGDWLTSPVPSVSAYSSTLECPAGITTCRTMYNKDKRYVFYEVILFCELHSGSRFVGGLSGVKSSAWRRRWGSRIRRGGFCGFWVLWGGGWAWFFSRGVCGSLFLCIRGHVLRGPAFLVRPRR